MIATSRTRCILCNSTGGFNFLKEYKRFPVFMGGTNDSQDLDLFADMKWGECKNCGQVQLLELLDSEKLYARSHNPSIGKVWQCHHRDFASFIVENSNQFSEKQILEVGGGNRKLFSLLKDHIQKYTILDKNRYVEEQEEKLEFLETFNLKNVQNRKFNIVVHSHTFEHFYDPIETTRELTGLLVDDGLMFASIPNIENVVAGGYGNGLNFEHTFLVSRNTIYKIFEAAGLRVLKLVDYNEHNLFVVAMKDKTLLESQSLPFQKQSTIFDLFAKKTEVFANRLASVSEPNLFLFGCHIFSQYLLNVRPELEQMATGILDNDPQKIGSRLYGHGLKVFSPNILKNIARPTVVLSAGIYNAEIKSQLLSINPETKIISQEG